MKAMLFAAGLGTRLRPLTTDLPKALVELEGKTLLEIALLKLKLAGCTEVVINIHHFAGMIRGFLDRRNNFGLQITLSDESDLLLDTGGGLKNAEQFLTQEGQPFIALNVDILSDIDLASMYQAHLDAGCLATLAVRQRKSSRYLLFDDEMKLQGWQNVKTGEKRFCNAELIGSELKPLAFSGIQILSPAIFSFMPSEHKPFSIIQTYLSAGAKAPITGYRHDEDFWMDVGRPEAVEEAIKCKGKWAKGIE